MFRSIKILVVVDDSEIRQEESSIVSEGALVLLVYLLKSVARPSNYAMQLSCPSGFLIKYLLKSLTIFFKCVKNLFTMLKKLSFFYYMKKYFGCRSVVIYVEHTTRRLSMASRYFAESPYNFNFGFQPDTIFFKDFFLH